LAIAALAGAGLGCAHYPQSGAPSPEAHAEPDLVGNQHVVQPGETLSGIASLYGVTAAALADRNRISDPRSLTAGQELIIPEEQELPGVPNSNRTGLARRLPSIAERGKGPSRDPHVQGDLEWPLRGVLYSRFGRRGKESHDGIDLAAPAGTPIKTAQAGTVLYAGEQKGYGLIAIVEHPNGLTTLYAHNRDLRVATGQRVREGQVIATVGESGRTTGPHLHFEVRKDGVPVDPLDHLGAIPQ
jgi:murein DD-endopeptidase MepM/ murein hydrolase activator NlpD